MSALWSSRFSGLRVGRILIGIYALAGLTAGIAAAVTLGFEASVGSGIGQGWELKVIAAAVVGGASLTGGRGSAIGALLGAILLEMIRKSLVQLGISSEYEQIVTGAALIVAVVIDRTSIRLQARRLQETARTIETSPTPST